MNAEEVMAKTPHPTFAVLRKYSVQGFDEHTNGFHYLVLQVWDGETPVAKCDFVADQRWAMPQNIDVYQSYRRRGIATALYVLAETYYGKPLRNIWANGKQSEESKAMWVNPNRPFGHAQAFRRDATTSGITS